jgi:hypothetical protein
MMDHSTTKPESNSQKNKRSVSYESIGLDYSDRIPAVLDVREDVEICLDVVSSTTIHAPRCRVSTRVRLPEEDREVRGVPIEERSFWSFVAVPVGDVGDSVEVDE